MEENKKSFEDVKEKALRLLEYRSHSAKELTDKIYELTSRKEPYSAAVLNSYLYFKEREIEQIITTIEKIRYGMTART